ncbi:MAG: hypothetical protein KGK01_07685 [Bradyrhizobium sp.]|uniref:hypothetical protein n=1 Tax=Bradyrhizobium sp. TaxID=376 RepID=UPI00239A5478|nr:hypothetical protein [Bradyrhizobium sp.]MDE2068973.1 hypothetical protein [Bradyrhizobium sp.]MDE2242313.1 hypothetical protein [Bradyrhizobium sp.]
MLALIVLISAAFRGAFGESRLIVGAAIPGFADTHVAVYVASSLPGGCRRVTASFQFSRSTHIKRTYPQSGFMTQPIQDGFSQRSSSFHIGPPSEPTIIEKIDS